MLTNYLDLDTTSPKSNVLFQAIRQAADAVLAADTRKMVSREVFVELVERVLPVVSGNLELLLDGEDPVSETGRRVLALAGGVLKTRVNGGNFPVLVEGLLGWSCVANSTWTKRLPSNVPPWRFSTTRNATNTQWLIP